MGCLIHGFFSDCGEVPPAGPTKILPPAGGCDKRRRLRPRPRCRDEDETGTGGWYRPMRLQDPLEYLKSLTGLGIRLDLAPLRGVLSRFRHPERRYRTVLVAGTNGKGSVAAMTSAILSKAGVRTGLYTSPHLVDYRERIRVDGKMITPAELKALIEEVRPLIDVKLTYFEFSTFLALLYFARRAVRTAVLEVGMGGRFDAANVVDPDVSVVTNIALEHKEFLGRSLRAIAEEKGGVIKEKGVCLTAARQKVVLDTLERICDARGARLYRLGRDIRVRERGPGIFSYRGLDREFDRVECPLPGRHQVDNAALAIGAVELLGKGISDEAVLEGLKATTWEGRLEILRRSPTLVVDGAHNPAAAAALRQALLERFTFHRLILLFGVLRDKDYGGILRRLAPVADTVILTRPGETDRARPPGEMAEEARRHAAEVLVVEDPEEALRKALRMAGAKDTVCATGSLYLVGAVKKAYHRAERLQETTSLS